MPTDIQYKDSLRKDLIIYKDWLKLLKSGETEKLTKELQAQIDRIEASLHIFKA